MLLAEVLGNVCHRGRCDVRKPPSAARCGKHRSEVRQQYDTHQQGHCLFIEVFPCPVADKQQLGFGMVDDVVDIVGLELMQNGNDDSSIGNVARKATAQCALLRPQTAILSPGLMPALSNTIWNLAIFRATSLYCSVIPL